MRLRFREKRKKTFVFVFTVLYRKALHCIHVSLWSSGWVKMWPKIKLHWNICFQDINFCNVANAFCCYHSTISSKHNASKSEQSEKKMRHKDWLRFNSSRPFIRIASFSFILSSVQWNCNRICGAAQWKLVNIYYWIKIEAADRTNWVRNRVGNSAI